MAANIDIGIEGDDRAAIADGLSRVLADSYTLYLKTHSFNWNVTGRMFNALHTMFEQQYTELAAAVDLIAERIRMLGFPAPGSYSVARTARKAFTVAEKANDQPTADLLTGRMEVHEKNAWMLRRLLE